MTYLYWYEDTGIWLYCRPFGIRDSRLGVFESTYCHKTIHMSSTEAVKYLGSFDGYERNKYGLKIWSVIDE